MNDNNKNDIKSFFASLCVHIFLIALMLSGIFSVNVLPELPQGEISVDLDMSGGFQTMTDKKSETTQSKNPAATNTGKALPQDIGMKDIVDPIKMAKEQAEKDARVELEQAKDEKELKEKQELDKRLAQAKAEQELKEKQKIEQEKLAQAQREAETLKEKQEIAKKMALAKAEQAKAEQELKEKADAEKKLAEAKAKQEAIEKEKIAKLEAEKLKEKLEAQKKLADAKAKAVADAKAKAVANAKAKAVADAKAKAVADAKAKAVADAKSKAVADAKAKAAKDAAAKALAAKKSQEGKQSRFAEDRIANLLKSGTDKNATTQKAAGSSKDAVSDIIAKNSSNVTGSIGQKSAQNSAPAQKLGGGLSWSDKNVIVEKLRPCWEQFQGGARNSVKVSFSLDQNGNVSGGVNYVSGANGYELSAAKRAVMGCSPIKGLPADKYASWGELIVNFTPLDISI